MNKIILSIAIAMSLTGCGAGASSDNTPMMAASMSQQTQDQHSFVVAYSGTTGQTEGYGNTSEEAAYDAVAWMVSNTWKAGSQAYRDMLTDKGLNVALYEGKKVFNANVMMTRQGVVIDVKEG
jgi:hypothetical protein